MRVALVTDGIWPYVLGGMQKHSYYLCKYLASQKVQVDLFHFNSSSYDPAQLQFFSAGEKQFITPHLVSFPNSHFPGHYLYDSYRYSRIIAKKILEDPSRYDLIYTKGFAGWYLFELPAKKRAKMPPLAVNFHGYEMFQKAPGFYTRMQHIFLLRQPVRRITRRADYVFSYGGKITQIISKLGVPHDKIKEVPTGVEASIVADGIMPTADITRFVFLGRYERRKGIEELNAAIGMLDKSLLPRAEFHFIGPIPPSRHLANCKYHGEVRDRDHLNRLLRGCDVLVCPSWSEGMPNVILEAMAQGLAVIATNTGATNELVHHGTGWLLAEASPALIREALTAAITMPPKELDEKKHNALRLVSTEFVWEKIGAKLIGIFERILSRG